MKNLNIIEDAKSNYETKLIQNDYNINVGFYVHLKEFNNNVRDELNKRIEEVFFFSKGINWKFDSFGIEKTGSRGTDIVGYFVFRTANLKELKKQFTEQFKDYDNAIKITCSVAEYQKISETFFELEV